MKEIRITGFLAIALSLLLCPGVFGANRDVCKAGCPYTTIQAAINGAQTSDLIRVAQGLYLENIRIQNSINLTIQGGWSPTFTTRSSDPSLTVVNGMGLDHVFYIYATRDENISVSMEGLTITNGFGYDGGGIFAEAYANTSSTTDSIVTLNLSNNRIEGNTATDDGGGIYAYAYTYSNTARAIMNVTLTNNRITENRASDYGGGLYLYGSSDDSYAMKSVVRFALSGNDINGNEAPSGGGVYCSLYYANSQYEASPSTIEANNINGNRAIYYSGLYGYFYHCPSATLSIMNNVISGNNSVDGAAVYLYTELSNYTIPFSNNTITRNTGEEAFVAYSDGDTGTPDNLVLNLYNNIIYGNFLQDADSELYFSNYSDGNMVVNSGNNTLGVVAEEVTYNDLGWNFDTNPLLGGDFHLLSGSPAINNANTAFAPATDKNGNARVGDPDRGAYEYLGTDHQAVMPAPSDRFEVEYAFLQQPIVASDPVVARPLSVYVDSSKVAHFNLALPGFTAPVDIYLGLYIPTVDPYNVYQIAGDLSLNPSATPIPWRAGQTAPVQSNLYGNLDMSSGWPSFEGFMYVIVTPQGASPYSLRYYEYQTSFYLQ